MAAAAVDVGYLAASYSVPETTIQSLLSEPTVDLVQSLLVQIEARARDFEDLQSEKLKVDVELDNTIRGAEQRARSLKEGAEKAQKETDELRQKLVQEGKGTLDKEQHWSHTLTQQIAETARQQIEAQLHDLQTKGTDSTTQILTLESRIKTLESQNRDALATYDTKATAYDRLAQELSDQHQKFVDLRKQLSTLEEKNQTLETAANNVKFRETNMQQEIEMLRKNNEWYDAELKTRTADNSKFRKEKNAQVAELQRTNADISETVESLRRTEALLRKHMEEMKQKADEDQIRIQQLEDDASKQEANFRSELDNAKRLVALQQKTAELAKNRLEELQNEYASLQENAAIEIGQLQAEVELERNKFAQAEASIANLESMVQELERNASQPKAPANIPATPRRTTNGAFGTPGRAGSPAAFSPGGSQLKNFAGNAMIMNENTALKEEMRKIRDEDERKTSLIAEMLEEMQQIEPTMEELRRTNETLSAQVSDMSNDIDAAIAEKDAARKDERKARGDLEGAQRECLQLRQNVEDLSVQLRSLIWRRQAEEQGLPSLTTEQQQFIINSENNQLPADHSYGDTATDLVISQHLVLYKNIAEVQAQNANLLRTIREVAQQYEGDEARAKKEQQDKDQEELKKLRTQVLDYEEQVRSLTTRSHSYKKERDMYRQVATNRGFVPADGDGPSTFGQSFNTQATMTPLRGASSSQIIPQTPQANQIPGVDKLVKDLQSHIDMMKEETAADRATLKSQVDNLTKDNYQLQNEKIHLESQVRREQDRCSRLESSAKLQEAEKNTLQERYHSIQATLAKQDDKVVKAEQEAIEALSRAQGLENELANLKASQSMWQTIEARLTERNQELMTERDRLNKMVAQVQSLQNEQELKQTEKRREFQDKIDTLEHELQIVRRKLEDELAEQKKSTAQRDWERTEAQKRIDELIKAKNEAEVRSASADTARQQLEQRVTELQSHLHAAEERAQSLRPRPTPRTNGEVEDESGPSNREEELAEQVADLERKLRLKQADLDGKRTEVEGYLNIAHEAEKALHESVEAYNTYEEEMTRIQQDKDMAIADLQRRVEEISSELMGTSSELAELRGKHEQDTLRLTQEKDALNSEIVRLKDDVADYKSEAERQTEYVKSQADIATRARQDYEHELAKHGETMKDLRKIRDEYQTIKSEVGKFKAQAEAARTALEQNEDHWKSTQSQYESQIAEVKRNHDDLKQYNKNLLVQFDNYKAQIDDLKGNGNVIITAKDSSPGSTNNLEQLITYLRREKEIKEVEYNMKEQEAKRLESQLGLAHTQIDQLREKLHAERAASAQGSQTGASLDVLQNQIEQLNVFRESNSVLRSEAARLESKLAEKTKEVETLYEELEPLRAKVDELEGELELSRGFHKQAVEDGAEWQKKFYAYLQKTDQIAPEEVEKLKEQVENLEKERSLAVEQVSGLEEKVKTYETSQTAAIEAAKETQKEELKGRFNKRHKQLMDAAMATKQAELDTLTTERNELQDKLTSLQQESEKSRQQLEAAQTQAKEFEQQVASLNQEVSQLKSQIIATQQELQSVKTAHDELLSRASTAPNAAANINLGDTDQVDQNGTQQLGGQVATLQKALDEAKSQLAEAQNRAFSADNKTAKLLFELSEQKEKVATLDKEVVSIEDAQAWLSGFSLISLKADKQSRIIELQDNLSTAQAQPEHQQSEIPQVASSAEPATSAEINRLKQELSEAQKALEDAKTEAEIAASASETGNKDLKSNTPQSDDAAALKQGLDQREEKLNALETALSQREAVVTKREGQTAEVKRKAQEKVTDIRNSTNVEIARLKEKITELETEITRLKQQDLLDIVTELPNEPINTEDLERPTVTSLQLKAWINQNDPAKKVIAGQIRKHVEQQVAKASKAKDTELAKLGQEVQDLKAQNPKELEIKSEVEPSHSSAHDVEAALSKAKAEHEQVVKKAVEKNDQLHQMKAKMKDGMLLQYKTKASFVEKAAKETPDEGVLKVWQGAVEAWIKVSEQNKAQAAAQKQAAAASASTPSQTQPSPVATGGAAQANGGKAPVPSHAVKPTPAQPPNPFLPAGQTGLGAVPNLNVQPQQQQQQQQGGRGRGDGVGTGPGALRGLFGNQSGIPRGGGSNIPLPGGRGRGQQGQQQPSSIAMPTAQTPGATQIGRGGARGGRGGGGRGAPQSQQTNPGSPRGGLNPGAAQFNPGVGRGQKRGADDEGEGATRGGKRPRGRGGQGGAPAAGAE